jgi:homeobox-leucine zipper protein
MQVKAVGDENKDIRQENDKLLAQNKELQQMLQQSCGRCHDAVDEKWRLLSENARLNHTYQRAQENLINLIHDANLPPSATMEHLASASLNLVPFTYNGKTTDQAAVLSYSRHALKEFMMLALNDEPMWLPTMNDKMLNDQEYKHHTFPGILGSCPQGFVTEATEEATLVRARAYGIAGILTDVVRCSNLHGYI